MKELKTLKADRLSAWNEVMTVITSNREFDHESARLYSHPSGKGLHVIATNGDNDYGNFAMAPSDANYPQNLVDLAEFIGHEDIDEVEKQLRLVQLGAVSASEYEAPKKAEDRDVGDTFCIYCEGCFNNHTPSDVMRHDDGVAIFETYAAAEGIIALLEAEEVRLEHGQAGPDKFMVWTFPS